MFLEDGEMPWNALSFITGEVSLIIGNNNYYIINWILKEVINNMIKLIFNFKACYLVNEDNEEIDLKFS